MIKTFFHRDQPATRHLTHAAFWVLLAMSVAMWTRTISVPDSPTEWFLGYLAALSALGLLLPTLLMRLPHFRDRATPDIVGFYELLTVIGLTLAWAGSLGLYQLYFSYDTVIHFVNSGLFTYIVLDATVRAFPALSKHWWKVWLIVLLIGMAGGVANELFEWGGDNAFGTKMFGKAGIPASLDTEYDLLADAAGVIVGIAVAQKRKRPV